MCTFRRCPKTVNILTQKRHFLHALVGKSTNFVQNRIDWSTSRPRVKRTNTISAHVVATAHYCRNSKIIKLADPQPLVSNQVLIIKIKLIIYKHILIVKILLFFDTLKQPILLYLMVYLVHFQFLQY